LACSNNINQYRQLANVLQWWEAVGLKATRGPELRFAYIWDRELLNQQQLALYCTLSRC